AQATVVEHGVDAGGPEFFVQGLRGGVDFGNLLRVDDAHGDLPGRHRLGPDDPGFVVVLLDRRGDDARNADPVAAHRRMHVGAAFIQHGEVHRLAVFAAAPEHVADFDPARDVPGAALLGTLAGHHL